MVPATCTEPGSETIVCDDCGETISVKELPALGHSIELKNAKEATCTEDGYTGDEICTVCGEIVKQGEVIPAHCPSKAFCRSEYGPLVSRVYRLCHCSRADEWHG